MHLVYGVRNHADHAFKTELVQLAHLHPSFHLHVVYSRPTATDTQGKDYHHTGHIGVPLLQQILPHGRHQFYLCGAAPLMESLVPALADWGVPRGDLHFEAFGPSSVRMPGDAANEAFPALATSVDIQFSRSGRTLSWNGADGNLLDFAQRHGIAVDAGCRAGSCGSCETPLLEGKVQYASPPEHDVAPGHCLMCIGTPATSRVVLCA